MRTPATGPATHLAAFHTEAPGLAALFRAHLRAQPGRIALLLGLALALAGLAILPPLLIGRLVDAALAGALTTRETLLAAAALALLAGADAGLTLFRRRRAIHHEMAVRDQAARARFAASIRLPLPAFAAGGEAALIRSFDDLDSVVELLASRVIDLIAEILLITAYATLLLAVNPRLALVFFLITAAGLASSILLAQASRRAADIWLPRRDARFGFIVECLTSVLTLKTLHAHRQVEAPFARAQQDEQTAMAHWRTRVALADAVNRFWAIATPGLGAAAGVALLLAGQITAGDLVLFLAVATGLVAAAAAAHQQLQEFHQARASLTRMRGLTTQAPENLDHATPGHVPETIRAHQLTYTHPGAAHPTLNALNITIAAGEHIAIIGRSGEGKTTFAHLLARLLAPTGGTIQTTTSTEPDLATHRRAVLLVPHRIAVFNTSLRENTRLWDQAVTDDAIRTALTRAGLETLITQSASGLDAPLGVGGNPLSAGQQQRLGLARMFLRHPEILILDEATGALDAETEREVLTNIRAFMQGRTLIAITHRESVAKSFPRILRMQDGRLS